MIQMEKGSGLTTLSTYKHRNYACTDHFKPEGLVNAVWNRAQETTE